jgi:lambda family phage minor tail protein L
MSISSDIQEYAPGQLIDLFVVDFSTTSLAAPPTNMYLYPGIKHNYGTLTFGGNDYIPFPMEITGFKKSSEGTLPRPVMRISNVTGFISQQMLAYNDFIGAKVSRYRTFAKYLDGEPAADFSAKRVEIYFIEQKKTETKAVVELLLVSPVDIMGVRLPSRVMYANTCSWEYRGAECGWTASDPNLYFTSNDTNTALLSEDSCGKRLESCKKRFCSYNGTKFDNPNASLPYGAFPALGRTG